MMWLPFCHYAMFAFGYQCEIIFDEIKSNFRLLDTWPLNRMRSGLNPNFTKKKSSKILKKDWNQDQLFIWKSQLFFLAFVQCTFQTVSLIPYDECDCYFIENHPNSSKLSYLNDVFFHRISFCCQQHRSDKNANKKEKFVANYYPAPHDNIESFVTCICLKSNAHCD